MKLDINLCTDKHEFCIETKNKIGTFTDAKVIPVYRSAQFESYLGSADVKNKDIFINLPKCYEVTNFMPFDIIEIISNTITHETVHCILEDFDTNFTVMHSEKIIRNNFDDIQNYLTRLRKIQMKTRDIIRGN